MEVDRFRPLASNPGSPTAARSPTSALSTTANSFNVSLNLPESTDAEPKPKPSASFSNSEEAQFCETARVKHNRFMHPTGHTHPEIGASTTCRIHY